MSETRAKLKQAKRWVVKIGSALLTNDGFGLRADSLDVWIKQIMTLKENGIESYLAVPVYGPTGKPIGHLGVMHDGPMPEGPPREAILRIFATCAGNELAHRDRTQVS